MPLRLREALKILTFFVKKTSRERSKILLLKKSSKYSLNTSPLQGRDERERMKVNSRLFI